MSVCDRWYIIDEGKLCIRCGCGEKFTGLLAWSEHRHDRATELDARAVRAEEH